MGYNAGGALNVAVEIVKTALTSGSIKLIGSHTSSDGAQRHATADALYLKTLLEGIQDTLMQAKT